MAGREGLADPVERVAGLTSPARSTRPELTMARGPCRAIVDVLHAVVPVTVSSL